MSRVDCMWLGALGRRVIPLCVMGALVFFALRADADELEDLMSALSFSRADVESVRSGAIVSGRLPSASDRELAIALAVKLPVEPEALVAALARGGALLANPKVKHFGAVPKPVATSDLLDLVLTGSQISRWRDASPGEDINLSQDEFSELHEALTSDGGGSSSATEIQGVARTIFYSRMRMYQISGLDGIASYRRSDGDLRDPAHEIRLATEADRKIGLMPSSFYDLLLAYPDRVPAQFREAFFWTLEEGPGGDLVNLTHRFSVVENGGYGLVQRQFFVSEGYNVEQAISRILPIKGGSVWLYTNRTSTDAVDGFGGSARRSIGDGMLESELKSVMQRILQSLSKKPN